MRTFAIAVAAAWFACTAPTPRATGQEQAKSPRGQGQAEAGGGSLDAINAEFERELRDLEARRLDRLAELAAGQAGDRAAETYEAYFRQVIATGLYDKAEPVAERVLKAEGTPATVRSLATLTNIVAEADRGAYDDSIASLRAAIAAQGEGEGAADPTDLPMATRLALIDAYYQRVIRADRLDVARKALEMIAGIATSEPVKDVVARRLRHLGMVGQPAPPIVGADLDGQPYNLAAEKGNAVLVVFWASWCVPCSSEVRWLDEVYSAYRDKGFRIVGVNLDPATDGGQDPATVLPNVRRFLIDHNVRWPNLLDGAGGHDFARAYGVTEIPTNFLVGRDGTIVHLDLGRANLEKAVAEALGR